MKIRDVLLGILVCLMIGQIIDRKVQAASAAPVVTQVNNANIMGSVAGTTLASCGTPVTPTECWVATGVYVWQSATAVPATATSPAIPAGWFLIAPGGSAGGITGITKNGTPVPVSNGIAALTITATTVIQ